MSVSCTFDGTTLIILSSRSLQVEAWVFGSRKLQFRRERKMLQKADGIYLWSVALPSLLKIRKSDLNV
jgi:hypothetical protein